MSDACTSKSAQAVDWTFDDAARSSRRSSPARSAGGMAVKPSNHENPALDSLAPGGGPTGPFTNALSAFAGISPNGSWDLFMLDDSEGVVGFEMPAFALNPKSNRHRRR